MHAVDADEEDVLVAWLHRGPTVRQSDGRRKEAGSKQRRHKSANATMFHVYSLTIAELRGAVLRGAQGFALS